MAILQIHIYICLPDRNYAQQESCLPDQASVHEDLADTGPLAHDDIGCPIRRDKPYQEIMGATADSLSGPPVSPSLFRSPISSASERPSPKAIQASIKESATLAAAISMQWKEEVSAMRQELADLRRDLCKELRAFNSNFNTFTQHYNTWSPQGGNMAAGADVGFGRGTGLRPRVGLDARGFGTSVPTRGTGGAREMKPQVSKVSVGTQARSKVLIRQSTADAAVNYPEEKEEKRVARRNLPKQLSMDPSILACPQPMYVESAIPLSLDPLLPALTKNAEQEPFDMTPLPSIAKAETDIPINAIVSSPDIFSNEPVASHGAVQASSTTAHESSQESVTVEGFAPLNNIDSTNESHLNAEASHADDMKSPISGLIERDKTQLPYPVPVVTVSPPEEHDYDIMSDSESLDPLSVDKPNPVSQEPPTVVEVSYAEVGDLEPADPELESKPSCSKNAVPFSVCEMRCPSIVVSEYPETDSPASPAESDTLPDHITLPDYHFDPPSELSSVSTLASTSAETQLCSEPESQDLEWPPLPEPLDTISIYHADLVHFDLVMLTSLDQDDLDSVFMDPEPEPFDLMVDSPSNTDNLDPPFYHSDSLNSPIPVDTATLCSCDPSQSRESAQVGPSMKYRLAHMSQEVTSEFPLLTVTISPPSSVSPDTSLEMDYGPTSPASDTPPHTYPYIPEDEEVALIELSHMEPNVMIVETMECISVSQEYLGLAQEETTGSPERSSSEQAFLWYRWQKRGQRRTSMNRSASVELWSRRYEYNSAEITYVSLTL